MGQQDLEYFGHGWYVAKSYPEYSGMTYEQASREAERLIERDGWYRSFARLVVLRGIMQRQSVSEAA